LRRLKSIGVTDTQSTVMMSDRKAGLAIALNVGYALSDKVACSRHVGNNGIDAAGLKGKKGSNGNSRLHTYVNRMAKAPTMLEYEKIENEMRDDTAYNSATVEVFLTYMRDGKQFDDDWSLTGHNTATTPAVERASRRFGKVDSNISESINSALSHIRMLPIAAAVGEYIELMHRLYGAAMEATRKAIVGVHGAEWETHSDAVRLEVVPASWKVTREDPAGRRLGTQRQRVVQHDAAEVAYLRWRCSCFIPQLWGVPCRHVIRVVQTTRAADGSARFELRDAVDSRLTIGAALDSLSYDLYNAISVDTNEVVANDLLPPLVDVPARRQGPQPSTRRRPSTGETAEEAAPRKRQVQYACGKCGGVGHNARSCKSSSSSSDTTPMETNN